MASSDQPLANWAWLHQNVPPDEHDRVRQAISEAIARKTLFELEHRVRRPDGSVGWTLSRAVPILDGNEAVIAWFGAASDITDRKRIEAEREGEQMTLATLIQRCPFGIYIVDDEFRMMHVNAATENVAFATVRPLIGRPFDEVVRIVWPEPVATDVINIFRHTLATGEPYCSGDFRHQRQDTEQSESYEWEVHRINLANGRLGAVCYYFDATKLRQAEADLRDSEERLRMALTAAEAGAWAWEITTGVITWSPENYLLYGYDPTTGSPPAYADWEKRVHPDDRGPANAAVADALAGRTPGFKQEFRVDHPARGERWLLGLGRVEFAPTGEPLRMVGINLDISNQKRAEETRRHLAAELAEADRRKDLFLATLAHELRNPLAPIRNGLEVMTLSRNSGDVVEEVCAMMDRQVTQLVRLVDDLLDVSRITQGKVELRKERVDLKAVIDAAVETTRPAMEQAGHELVVSVTGEPILVYGDAARLAQVVSNVLHNSAKYTHPGGHVRLTAQRKDGAAVVSVKDTGIGIPPPLLERVFEMFAQLDRTLEKTTGGLGIGLSLTKALLEMHDGTIEAHSDGEGMGSEFVIRLPVVMDILVRPARPERDTSEAVLPALRRILVVDDNVDSANSLGQMLKLMGNEVRTANDGEAGVGVAAQFRPDLVLMDIGMPKLNGYDAARRIRQHPWGRGITLVALTGWGQEDDRKKSADAGFDHHLVKPVAMQALRKLMSSQ